MDNFKFVESICFFSFNSPEVMRGEHIQASLIIAEKAVGEALPALRRKLEFVSSTMERGIVWGTWNHGESREELEALRDQTFKDIETLYQGWRLRWNTSDIRGGTVYAQSIRTSLWLTNPVLTDQGWKIATY